MFSSDGTATQLFLYSDERWTLLRQHARSSLRVAAGKAMKYEAWSTAQVTVGGAVQIAAAVHDALIHDAVLLAVILLTVVALASMWRSAVHGAAVGVGVLASYRRLGVSIALWQHLLDRELNALVPLVSFAVSLRARRPAISLPASKPVMSPTRQRVRGPRGRYPGGSGCAACGARVAYSARWCQEVPSSVLSQVVVVLVWAC